MCFHNQTRERMWARLFFLSLSALFSFSSYSFAAETEATYYVSPSGSDANAGTKDAPFKTLTQAQKAVQKINASMSGDIMVYLREGTYKLTSTLHFGNSDGGSNGFYVRYENYPGETPVITGGLPVTGWSLCDEANGIWCASGVSYRFRQFYVNGEKAIRARTPNLESDGSHNFYRLTKVDTTGKAFDVATSYVSDWKNFDKVEMHLMIAWADATLRLSSYTNYGSYSKVQIQDPEKTMLFNRPYPMLGVTLGDKNRQQCFYFENAYEFLDAPGEWYLDESKDILYYKPRSGESMNSAVAVAPNLETLIDISGSSTSNKVGYLSFKGIAFEHSNFLRPSKSGFLDLQAGQFNVAAPGGNNYMLWRPAAGVTVTNAHHIRFERNSFSQMAATGLDFISGTDDDAIIGNVFTNLGGSGISIGKFAQDTLTEIHIAYNPTDKEEICTRDTIKNNLVTKVTTEIQGAVGIGAGYPRYVDIEHNEVSYTNYSGISVGFGWTKNETAMTNNKINSNNIHHVAQLLADAGAIYTLSNQGRGSEIQYNYMHDISASKWADYWICPIYLDEGSSGFDVSHNVAVNAPGGVACNSCGAYTKSDNEGTSATTIASAGIEAAYSDIKTLAIPLPDFSEIVPQASYKDALNIPGIIEAEDYDVGGQGVSYSDNSVNNEGGAYRTDGVDIVGNDTTGYKVGYTADGEWMEYTVNVGSSEVYTYEASVSSGLDGSSFRLFLDDEAISDTIKVPQGEDWDTYTPVSGKTSALATGTHVLKIAITGSYVNIDKIKFTGGTDKIAEISKDFIEGSQAFGVYNIAGKYLGTFQANDIYTLKAELNKCNLKSGIYLVRSKNRSKFIQIKK